MSTAVFGRQVAAVQRADAWRASILPILGAEKSFPGHGLNQSELDLKSIEKVGRPQNGFLKSSVILYSNPFAAGLAKQESDVSCSSGSEHETSLTLDLEDSFLSRDESQHGKKNSELHGGFQCKNFDMDKFYGNDTKSLLQALSKTTNSLEIQIFVTVSSSLASDEYSSDARRIAELGETSKSLIRRRVMMDLKSHGLNAAVCKSRWDHGKNSPGGVYEYIDVEGEDLQQRILVDIQFRDQFVIAKPSTAYENLLATIPTIFVGKADRLQQIVNIMSEAMKQSARLLSLHLPPWRKPEYIQSKWFSSYKRTTNDISEAPLCLSDDIFSADYNSLMPLETGSENSEWELPTVLRLEGTAVRCKGQLSLALKQ